MGVAHRLGLLLGLALLLSSPPPAQAEWRETPWPVTRLAEPPATWDGRHVVEGTSVAEPWGWHARLDASYRYGIALADSASQLRGRAALGVGLPASLGAAISIPFGYTIGSLVYDSDTDLTGRMEGMCCDGGGMGDLQLTFLYSIFDASEGGLGLLFGVKGTVPTGNHDRLLGEGGFTAEPFGVLAFQLLGSRIAFNIAYRARPEHRAFDGEGIFEQDDDLIWRFGIRIPRKHDVAWSIEAEGALGVLTDEGWPSSRSRPVWAGGGVDFPLSRLNRLGLLVGAGIVGETAPRVTFGLSFTWLPTLPDEDDDGVAGGADECPLLVEDLDGYEDEDGCPDLDNDRDGFPDDEDQCPQKPATDDYSEDGC